MSNTLAGEALRQLVELRERVERLEAQNAALWAALRSARQEGEAR